MPGGGSLSKHLLGGSERVSELRWRRRLERNVASLPEGMTRKREEKVERVPHVNLTFVCVAAPPLHLHWAHRRGGKGCVCVCVCVCV